MYQKQNILTLTMQEIKQNQTSTTYIKFDLDIIKNIIYLLIVNFYNIEQCF